MKWEVLGKSIENNSSGDIVKQLLLNRGLKTKKEVDGFINPRNPNDIKIEELGITQSSLKKVLKRLEIAKKNKEKIIIYGDYDCDGVCATAILWEVMYKLGYDIMPFIPDRFKDGYGLKSEAIRRLKEKDQSLSLIITIDNGIVAHEAINDAKKLGIDIIVIDHHQKGKNKLTTPYVLHSTLVCGSALAWFLVRELGEINGLDLVTLGTVADQMPLLGINRSIVKFGLPEVLKTKRIGLQSMFKDLKLNSIGTYEVGYLIAPRINAMGRLAEATDALRFLCTRDLKKASELNKLLNKTNIERQKIVDGVLKEVLNQVQNDDKIIVIEGKYHEGVIGLASGKVTEKHYKPSIVLSMGERISKASARSISGFNIIDAIKETELILEGGGHPMAAGFSIETTKIEEFRFKINELNKEKLTEEILEKKLKIDLEINFESINNNLVEELKKFEPVGQGNYSPIFVTESVTVSEVKPVGQEGKHLKLKFEKDGIKLDAIWFGFTNNALEKDGLVSVVYSVEENVWNSKTSIQLKIRDIKNDKDIHSLD